MDRRVNGEVPGTEYFEELFRVSKNQIIWGVNYFQHNFAPGRIVWDKVNGQSSFSDCEIAYCSFHDSVRLFRYMWNPNKNIVFRNHNLNNLNIYLHRNFNENDIGIIYQKLGNGINPELAKRFIRRHFDMEVLNDS